MPARVIRDDEGRFGPYQLIERLGTGGSAFVFLARGPDPGHPVVALKRPRRGAGALQGSDLHLRTEAAITMSVDHPNVVHGVEAGEIAGEPYLAVELMIGETVLELAEVLRARSIPCPVQLGISVLLDGLLALSYLRARRDPVVHGDVTPRNLMLGVDGRCRLFDFGLARLLSTPVRRQVDGPHTVVGTPGYLAPELIRGAPAHPGSDMYGLGASVHRLLSGQPLHDGPTPEILTRTLTGDIPDLAVTRPDLPRWLRGAIGALLSRDPRRRPALAGRLLLDILHDAIDAKLWWSRGEVRRWHESLARDTLAARHDAARRARRSIEVVVPTAPMIIGGPAGAR